MEAVSKYAVYDVGAIPPAGEDLAEPVEAVRLEDREELPAGAEVIRTLDGKPAAWEWTEGGRVYRALPADLIERS